MAHGGAQPEPAVGLAGRDRPEKLVHPNKSAGLVRVLAGVSCDGTPDRAVANGGVAFGGVSIPPIPNDGVDLDRR